MFQVLWVENDPEILDSYPLEAEDYNLQLVPFSCWEDAEKALDKDYTRWDAIILDAKCQYKKDDVDNASRFLSNVLNRLQEFAHLYGRRINWYILSGQSEENISDLIPETRKLWDKDWSKGFYSKNVDREILFHRICIHARKKHEFIVRNDLYPRVFRAIEKSGLPNEVYVWMEDLLLPIHFPNETADKDYNNRFQDVRKILEHIFRSMIDNSIVPPIFEKKDSKKKDELNLSAISLFLANKLSGDKLYEKYPVNTEKEVLPRLLQEMVKNIIFATGSTVHTSRQSEQGAVTVFSQYLPTVKNSTYMLKSYALGMCDLIIWYAKYLDEHPDKEINALDWDIIKKNKDNIRYDRTGIS